MNRRFQEASEKERILIRQLADLLGVQFIPAPEKCRYDAVFERDGVVSIVEAKVRSFPHDRYETALLEKAKFDGLISYLDGNMCHKALYVSFYTDDVALVWNLQKIEPKWTNGEFVKTTMGNRSKKEKIVAYLPIQNAVLIRL